MAHLKKGRYYIENKTQSKGEENERKRQKMQIGKEQVYVERKYGKLNNLMEIERMQFLYQRKEIEKRFQQSKEKDGNI